MNRIPPAALLLGIAGLAPFITGAMLSLEYLNAGAGGFSFLNGTDGPLIMLRYGVIILCFMSGALWGFATTAPGMQGTAAFALSVVPALWVFLNPGAQADAALINLMIGFSGLLLLDYAFHRWSLCPEWWMALRVPLTLVVLICLAIGVWA
ncbi:MAG: DUF3429 domain-containing protein [Sulfitobacter sp.]